MTVTSATDAAAQSAGAAARTSLTANYETFLVLLTAQLQNQDPLSPMDSNQFTQQLVQYSQVEQQIRTNDQLESLISQSRAAAAGSALGYLGRTAIIDSDTAALVDGSASWSYNIADYAQKVRLEVRDSAGRTVYATDAAAGEGERTFTWDGKNASGVAQAAGAYQLVVTATDAEEAKVDVAITVRETIQGVDLASNDPQIMTSAGARGLDSIRAILDQ